MNELLITDTTIKTKTENVGIHPSLPLGETQLIVLGQYNTSSFRAL